MTELELLEKIKTEELSIEYVNPQLIILYNNTEAFDFFISSDSITVNGNASIDVELIHREIKNKELDELIRMKHKQLIEKRLVNG